MEITFVTVGSFGIFRYCKVLLPDDIHTVEDLIQYARVHSVCEVEDKIFRPLRSEEVLNTRKDYALIFSVNV